MISTYQRPKPSIKEAVMDRMAPVIETLTDHEMLEAGLAQVSDVFNKINLQE